MIFQSQMSLSNKRIFSSVNKQQHSSLLLGFCLLIFVGFSSGIKAQTAPRLSDKAEIFLLSCSPGQEVWAHYGHTGIRVLDPLTRRDVVFNYGIFDFNSDNFLWNFVRGEIDYILGTTSFEGFMHSYRNENRRVVSQRLNLSPEEKARLWEALVINSLPENRTYRYSFYYDNCSTRARKIIERSLDGQVHYNFEPAYGSMREVVQHYTAGHPWTWFGISFALSSLADAPAPAIDLLFAPELMMEAFDKATVSAPKTTEESSIQAERQLIDEQSILYEIKELPAEHKNSLPGPTVLSWILFALVLTLGLQELKTARRYPWADALLFGLAGLAGVIIAFLAFVSVHPVTKVNYLLIWIQPLHLLFALLALFRPFRQSKLYKGYLKINLAVLLFALTGFCFLPQYVHPAMIPLLLSLLSRSLMAWINPLPKSMRNKNLPGKKSGKPSRLV